jgi:hypothetical protein
VSTKRLFTGTLLVLASLVLAACMLLPGKFGSDLTLHRDGTFSFTYKGEIFLLPLSKLAQDKPAGTGEKKPFTPSPCRDEGSQASRPCTKAEVDAQRRVGRRAARGIAARRGERTHGQGLARRAGPVRSEGCRCVRGTPVTPGGLEIGDQSRRRTVRSGICR